MRKINMKKLNNKGFTLIELLAVIVILAVVMGVAASQVLNAMNNSRKSSLQNSALSAADAFRTAYAEYSMGGQTSLVGISGDNLTKTGQGLLDGKAIKLNTGASGSGSNVTYPIADALNITATNYDLTNSYVYFDKTNSKFTVCLVASSTGSYYVANAVKYTRDAVGGSPGLTATQMWACSDNKHSWQ